MKKKYSAMPEGRAGKDFKKDMMYQFKYAEWQEHSELEKKENVKRNECENF